MNTAPPVQNPSMAGGLRAVLFAAAAILFVVGLVALYAIVKMIAINYYPNYQVVTHRDVIYLLLWAVVSVCFVAIGINLFRAARLRLIYDVIPGPTLYILGVSLVIIGMFLVAAGGLLPGALMAVAGFFAMWLEFKSTFI